MATPTRVLVAMSDTGGGHRGMSNAIAGALKNHYGDCVEVQIEDVFALGGRSPFEVATSLYATCIRVAPWLYGWMYNILNDPARYRRFGAVQVATRRKIATLIDRFGPDVIVNTHPLANRPLLDAIEVVGRPIPVLASVSELVTVHTSWVEPRLRLLNTATTESYQAVLDWGANPERVRCVGLPVDERFTHFSAPPSKLRIDLGLNPDLFTALLIGGGEGAGGLATIVDALQETDLEIQLIVVCGRNAPLKAQLEARDLRMPTYICGFVKTIPDLMHASDVIVTKGGPQTIAEALVAGRPVILTELLPGQEEGNGIFVEGRGVGFGPGTADEVVGNLARLAKNPDERAWMTENAHRHGRPEAAAQVAAMVMELAGHG
jgi:1,2-diacylglycerol 3-beta-galactosyltransferase